jgi:hypothetical protein
MMSGTVSKSKMAGLLFGLALACAQHAAAQHTHAQHSGAQVTPAEGLARYEKVLQATTDPLKRFDLLMRAATTALEAGELEKAKDYAHAVLEQAPAFRENWNYGNGIHVANLVLGRLALAEGDAAEAGRLLVEAGKTPGSPQLGGFGPNMLLAKELLEKGRRAEVVEYLTLAAKFWKAPMGRLDKWKEAVARGETPDFGPSVGVYLNTWRSEKWDKLAP